MPDSPETLDPRDAARALYKERAARLGDELDHMTKLIRWARECLETELMSGLGYKQMGISDKDLQKLANLSTSLERAVSAKIRFDKSAKDMADSMTPEEEFESVLTYIKSLDPEQMRKMNESVRRIKEATHEKAKRESTWIPKEPA